SWSVDSTSRECDSVLGADAVGALGGSSFGGPERGEGGGERRAERMEVGGRVGRMEGEERVDSCRMCSLSSGVGVLEGDK
ncbi:unnamed protein product, partial [Closterium sp. Naga37s-1]